MHSSIGAGLSSALSSPLSSARHRRDGPCCPVIPSDRQGSPMWQGRSDDLVSYAREHPRWGTRRITNELAASTPEGNIPPHRAGRHWRGPRRSVTAAPAEAGHVAASVHAPAGPSEARRNVDICSCRRDTDCGRRATGPRPEDGNAALAACRSPHFEVGAWDAGPGVPVDDHRPLGSPGPGDDAGRSAGALHGFAALVLLVVGVRPQRAGCTGGGVDDAAAPVRAFQLGWSPAVQVALGEQCRGHVYAR